MNINQLPKDQIIWKDKAKRRIHNPDVARDMRKPKRGRRKKK